MRTITRAGTAPLAHRGASAAVRLRLPFQAVRSDDTALTETRLSFGFELEATPLMGARPGLPVAALRRPLARLSFDFTGRADALRLNGLPLLAPDALAAGEDATEPADTPRKKHKSGKWW